MLTIDALLRESQVDAKRIERLHTQLGDLGPERIGEAIDALAEKQRLALALRYYESLTVEEIAAVLGSRPDTIQTLLARATEMLCKHLEKEVTGYKKRSTASGGAAR